MPNADVAPVTTVTRGGTVALTSTLAFSGGTTDALGLTSTYSKVLSLKTAHRYTHPRAPSLASSCCAAAANGPDASAADVQSMCVTTLAVRESTVTSVSTTLTLV